MKTTLSFIIVLFFILNSNAQVHNFDGESIIYGHDSNKLTIGSSIIQSSGFGLGESLLEVTSSTFSAIRLGATNSELFLISSDQFGHSILTPQNSPLKINNILRTDKDYVTINTTYIPVHTDYKLVVGGGILAEEVKIQLESAPWPDYVFKSTYKLPTLEDVEKQIKEKGHLANVPSAEEVEVNGFEVGDMTTILLQKIEELTLYTIEQEKRIKALETQLAKKQ